MKNINEFIFINEPNRTHLYFHLVNKRNIQNAYISPKRTLQIAQVRVTYSDSRLPQVCAYPQKRYSL